MLMGVISDSGEIFCVLPAFFKFQHNKYSKTHADSGIELASCQALFKFLFLDYNSLILITMLCQRHFCYPRFTDEETEVQRG